MGFTFLDYSVLVLYLVATAIFGLWMGRGQVTLRDYFLGGRNLPWWAVCFSIVATETSTLTFIGVPAIAFSGSMVFIQVALGYIIGKTLVSFLLIPAYFKGEIQSAYEVLFFRFGKPTRNASALVFQVNRALADGVRLFATALVLSVVTGIGDIWTVTIIGVITVVYTVYGGLTAVVWNDVVQLFVYVGGALLAALLLVDRIPGGLDTVLSTASDAGKLQFFDFAFSWNNPYTFWAALIGGAFLTFATHGTDQMMVQRYLACRSRRDSQMALIASGVIMLAQFFVFLTIGVMLYCFYDLFPMEQELTQADRVFPTFIVQEMPSGISGLIIAAVFAAAMSTLSSSLNSLSSSTVNDFYRAYIAPKASDGHYLRVSRLVTVAWGLVLVVVSILARNWGEVLEVGLTITSLVMGSVLGVFLLGALGRVATQRGALVGMVCGLIATLAAHFSGYLAWTWYVLIGTMVTVLVGLVVSRAWAQRPGPSAPRTQ